jgi:hypothetical protein
MTTGRAVTFTVPFDFDLQKFEGFVEVRPATAGTVDADAVLLVAVCPSGGGLLLPAAPAASALAALVDSFRCFFLSCASISTSV